MWYTWNSHTWVKYFPFGERTFIDNSRINLKNSHKDPTRFNTTTFRSNWLYSQFSKCSPHISSLQVVYWETNVIFKVNIECGTKKKIWVPADRNRAQDTSWAGGTLGWCFIHWATRTHGQRGHWVHIQHTTHILHTNRMSNVALSVDRVPA